MHKIKDMKKEIIMCEDIIKTNNIENIENIEKNLIDKYNALNFISLDETDENIIKYTNIINNDLMHVNKLKTETYKLISQSGMVFEYKYEDIYIVREIMRLENLEYKQINNNINIINEKLKEIDEIINKQKDTLNKNENIIESINVVLLDSNDIMNKKNKEEKYNKYKLLYYLLILYAKIKFGFINVIGVNVFYFYEFIKKIIYK